MKTISKSTIICILPLVLSILYFFTVKGVIPNYLYLALALIASLYFIPYRLMLFDYKKSDLKLKEKLYYVLSNAMMALIIILSAIYPFDGNSMLILKYFVSFIVISNLILAFLFLFENKKNEYLYHYCFSILAIAIKAI